MSCLSRNSVVLKTLPDLLRLSRIRRVSKLVHRAGDGVAEPPDEQLLVRGLRGTARDFEDLRSNENFIQVSLGA